GQSLAAKNFVAGAGIEPRVIRPGKGDADASFVSRLGDHAAQASGRIENLNANVTGDKGPALLIDGQAVATAVGAIYWRAQFHVAFTGPQCPIRIDHKA